MDEVAEAVLDDQGIIDNADRGGRRQVTVISAEAWADACAALGDHVDPITRRANLLVSGLDLADSRGRTLRIGDTELEITTETVPCRLMDMFHDGLMGRAQARLARRHLRPRPHARHHPHRRPGGAARPMRQLACLVVAACLAGCTTDAASPAVTEAPISQPTVPSRTQAVIEALGMSALDAMGVTVDELCERIPLAPPQSDYDLIVFLHTDADDATLEAVRREVRDVDPDAVFVSQEEAYREFTEDLFADQDEIVELVTPELLPASFRLDVPNADIASLEQRFQQLDGVRRVLASDSGVEELTDAVDSRLRDACQS